MVKAQRWTASRFGGPDVLELTELELAAPAAGEIVLEVRASGLNPADLRRLASGPPESLPVTVGSEVAGVIAAIGPGTQIASGGGAVGDEVVAFRVVGGYSTALTVPAKDVFAKPANLDWAEAAGFLLVSATAAELVATAGITAGDTVLLHGAAGAVGSSALQQAAQLGATVVGTASPGSFGMVQRFGGIPVSYGEGLAQRAAEAVAGSFTAALDAVGTDEAVDVSLALVADRSRIVTAAAMQRAARDGFRAIGAGNPASSPFRDAARAGLLARAAAGELTVPVAATYDFSQAPEALAALSRPHPPGKLALLVRSS